MTTSIVSVVTLCESASPWTMVVAFAREGDANGSYARIFQVPLAATELRYAALPSSLRTLALLAATGDTEAPAVSDAVTTTEAPAVEEEVKMGGTLIVSGEAEVANPWTPAAMQCDSYCQQRARTFYDTLVTLDENLEVKGVLGNAAAELGARRPSSAPRRTLRAAACRPPAAAPLPPVV